MSIKLVIFGTRTYWPTLDEVEAGITRLLNGNPTYSIKEIVCGMAAGGDEMGRRWAKVYDIPGYYQPYTIRCTVEYLILC
jgi:hypothetical protein